MLEATPQMLLEVGFQELVFEDFLDIFKDLIKRIVQPEPGRSRLTPRVLFDTFNNAEGNIHFLDVRLGIGNVLYTDDELRCRE